MTALSAPDGRPHDLADHFCALLSAEVIREAGDELTRIARRAKGGSKITVSDRMDDTGNEGAILEDIFARHGAATGPVRTVLRQASTAAGPDATGMLPQLTARASSRGARRLRNMTRWTVRPVLRRHLTGSPARPTENRHARIAAKEEKTGRTRHAIVDSAADRQSPS